MVDIERLFDDFALAYRHSLYALDREELSIQSKKEDNHQNTIKQYSRSKSLSATATVNNLMANIHHIMEVYDSLKAEDSTILRVAEYLCYGVAKPNRIDQVMFSGNTIPWVMPFLGHSNLYIESKDDECHQLGLQFVIQTLMQTAPGQLKVTVFNPDIRPEFAVCSRLEGFKMITSSAEIGTELSELTEEIIQNDVLLSGTYSSIVELRKAAKQPVGQLRLLVIQSGPKDGMGEYQEALRRIVSGGPRAGFAVIYLRNISSRTDSVISAFVKQSQNTIAFEKERDHWISRNADFDGISFSFPALSGAEITQELSRVSDASKKSAVITIPFGEIENFESKWRESSASNLVFNLGKSGLETVSVCLGDRVTQHHNILISGAAGKGKSNLIEVMIHSLCIRYSPSEVELYLLDFKDGLTFKPYSSIADGTWLPHAKMLGIESDRDVGVAVLKDLEDERKRRAEVYKNCGDGIRDYESYRKCNPDAIMPRIVLVIDEYQKLFDIGDEISEEAAALLENLVRQGRACAIHIILASQSITGAVGLLGGKDERIYAQFPVRIALQNTVTESYSILGMGNDAAAKLRVRGEAIINVNYGAPESNKRFTVAYADPDQMRGIRASFCREWRSDRRPIVFKNKDTVDFSQYIESVETWRNLVSSGGALRIPCGIKLSVNKEVLGVSFSNDVGRNIAILGAGEDLQLQNAKPGQLNNAIGILQGFALATALQRSDGDARFVVIDGLAKNIRENANIPTWLILMERLGYPVEVVPAADASNWLIELNNEVCYENYEEDTYIIGMGMDKCSDLTEMNLAGECGANAFQSLLKYGTKGIHFVCWWSSISMYQSHIGFGNEGYFGNKILLRLDTSMAREVLGPFVNWSIRDNRAYIHDASDLAEDTVVMPMIPVTNRIRGLIEARCW